MRTLTIVAALMLWAGVAEAQTDDNVLKGITKAKILIEPLGSNAAICKVSDETLRTALLFPLSERSIPKIEQSARAYIYLDANVMPIKSASGKLFGCSYSFKLDVRMFYKAQIVPPDRTVFARLLLWDRFGMGYADLNSFSKYLADDIGENSKKLAVDWMMDNQ